MTNQNKIHLNKNIIAIMSLNNSKILFDNIFEFINSYYH